MMPGETHSQTAGIASDATIGTCQNCTALQQNLNEYVAAILAMKQKIIDTDHLLTEYQQKCDELQKVERESSTLHHQLDDLLLKCTPLEEQSKKQIEEIQAMKSELEEKRSSIKIYQQTYLEIESLKEENNKTEAVNKKLEAQVKKLEETTTKQSQEIKQLKKEKKTLEKDLKKTHKQLEKTEKRNQQKVLKHAWTQNNSTEETKIDKTKMKLLLEELWMCIEPSAQVSQRKDIQHFSEDTGKHRRRPGDLQHSMQTHFPGSPLKDQQHFKLASFPGSPLKDQQHCKNGPFPSSPLKDMQFCKHSPIPIDDLAASTRLHNLAVPEMQHNTKHKSIKHTQMIESSSRERDHFNEGPILNKETGQKYLNEDLLHVSGDEQMAHSPVPGQNLDEILDWLKPLPPLLSPVHFSLPHNQDTLLDNSTNLNEEEEEEKVISNSNELKKLCEGDKPSENPESINKHFSEPSMAQAMDLPLVGLSNNTSSSALLFHKHPPCMLTEAECDDKAILEQQMRESNPSFLEESTEMMDVQSDSLQIGDNSDYFNSSVEANENDTLVDNLQKETSQHSTVKVEAVEDCVLNSSASDEGSTGVMKSDSEQLKNIQSLQEPESSGTEYMEVEHVKQEETQKDIEAVKESLINASTDSATLSHHEDIIENNLKSSAPVASDDQNMLFVDSPTKHCLSRGEKEAQDSSAKDYLTFLATKESEIKESQPLQSNGTTNIETVNEASVGCFQNQEISCTGELSHSTGFTKNEVECATEIEMVSMAETFTVLQKPNLKGNVYAKISDGAYSAKENELSHKSSESTEDEAGLTKAPEMETVAVNGYVLQQAHLTGTTCKPNCDETDPATESVSTNYSTGCTEDEIEHLAESEMLTVADTCSGLQKAQFTGTCHKPNTERTSPIKENKSSVDSSACNEYEVECGREAEMIKRTETPFSLLQKSSLTPNAYATNPNGADRIIAEKPTSYSLESTSFTKTDGTTDVKSSIEETSSDIIMMEERLCSKVCPVTQEETEDDQDNFTLQRKVKKTRCKGNGSSGLEEKGINLSSCKESVPEVPIDVQASVDNQMSMNDNKALEMSEEGIPNIDTCDALKVKIDSKDLTTEHTSLNKHSDRSTSETTTDENSDLEQDEMAYKKKPEENMEICKRSIVVNGAECSVQVTGLDNVLTTGPDSQHGDNASNESLLCESSEMVLSEESENISIKDNDTSNKVSPPVVPKTEIKEETAVSSHIWQHSASVQNTKAKQKEKEPSQTTPPVLATADTSTSIKHSPDSISKVRTEMGPPLRPLLPPLLATPPRFLKCISPPMSTCSRSSFPSPSPMEDLVSPLRETPIPPLMSPLSDGLKHKSPLLATPSPSDITKNRRIQSSPLQFCAATPKHAVPVPGRLPPSAMNAINSSPGIPQENSVRILDTMYPELSARARTLNILKGNIQLTRCASGVGNIVPGPVNQISGFKAINSSTTAFTKTGKACEAENSCFRQVTERLSSMGLPDQVWKRPGVNLHLPKSAKRLRLDNDSPVAERVNLPVASLEDSKSNVSLRGSLAQPVDIKSSEMLKSQSNPTEEAISKAFEKITKCCFDLMPVIRSHVHVGNISQVPVLRDEEKEVIHEFCVVNKHLAEGLLVAILTKLKTEKKSMKSCYLQALCRVYVGICRQQGDLERARLFSYSILKEDFPESDKLILFVASTWHNVFSLPGLINKAMQAVTRQRAKGEVLTCLSAYLGWEKNPPCDVAKLITGTILALKTGVSMKFQPHEKRGEDLSPPVWDHIFATELLCSQLQWKWTHDNLICKELWPVMNKWVRQGKGIEQVGITSDVTVAAVLRLIGRLGQLGLKKRYVDSVKNVATVINTFGRHANAEGVPWGVQLATVYAIYDLAPSNPKEAMESLAAWRSETTRTVPPAVTSCITQMGSMCRQIR